MENSNCQYTDKDIWNYYSNILSRDEEAEMQEHILACSSCKKRLQHLRSIADSLDEEPDTNNLSNLKGKISSKKSTIKYYLVISASIAASIALLLWIVGTKDKEGPEDNGHPIYNIGSPSYSVGDTLAVDSTDVELELDTLSIH